MKYIFIDTNEYIGVALTKSTSAEDKKVFEATRKILNEKEVKLLIPEVVEIEFKKNMGETYNKFLEQLENIKKPLEGLISLPKYKVQLDQKITQITKILESSRKESIQQFTQNIFRNKKAIYINLNSVIISNSIKRCIANLRPYHSVFADKTDVNQIDKDCLVIESIKHYVNKNINKNDQIIICTEDQHYYVDKDSKQLHGDIKSEFKNVKAYKKIFDLLNTEIIKAPSEKINPEKLESESERILRRIRELQTLPTAFSSRYSNSVPSSIPSDDFITQMSSYGYCRVCHNPLTYITEKGICRDCQGWGGIPPAIGTQ